MLLSQSKLIPQEKQAIWSIASIYALRLLGLFMLVPIITLYAQHLTGATPFLIGLALGGYGLTQAIFQIPFGRFSDRYGRKLIIALGLIIFATGSVVAALSHSILGLIIGRCLQGAGAVGSATSALLADLTREEQRTKAMAVTGITIGIVFSLAMVLGPLLNSWFSVPVIFWITLLFALAALGILYQYVPTPHHIAQTGLSGKLTALIFNGQLFRLNLGIFFLHAILTANFVVLPLILEKFAHLPAKQQWQLYLPCLFFAFVCVIPLIRFTETKKYTKTIFLAAIAIIGMAELLLGFLPFSLISIGLYLWLFFTAFTLLEAMIPSLVSKIAVPHLRGGAMGVNSSYQFLGIFVGGGLGGWLYGHFQTPSIFLACALIAILWLSVDIIKVPE